MENEGSLKMQAQTNVIGGFVLDPMHGLWIALRWS